MHFYPRQGAQQISKFSEREIARYIQPPTPHPPAPTVLTLKFPPTLSLAPWSLYCKDRMVVPNADINKNKIQAKIFVLQLSLITISIQINGRKCPKKCFYCANRSAKPRFFAYISVSGFQITTLRHCTFVGGGGGVNHVVHLRYEIVTLYNKQTFHCLWLG